MIKFLKDIDRALHKIPASEGEHFVFSYWCPFVTGVALLASSTILGGLATFLALLVSYAEMWPIFTFGFYATFYLVALALTVVITGAIYSAARPKQWVFTLPDESQTQEADPSSSRSTSSRMGRA